MKTDFDNEGQRASKSAQEDALRRYALIEHVLRCSPAMLSAIEGVLGVGK